MKQTPRLSPIAGAALASFAIALGLRFAFLVEAKDSPFMSHRLIDEHDYHVMALRLLAHTWPGHEALFRPPLYPIFLAGIYRLVGDDIWSVKLIQLALGSLVAPLTAVIAWLVYDSPRIALAAGLVVAACGPLIYYDAQILAGSLDVLLVTASVALILHADARNTAASWGVAGAVVGLSALNRGALVGAIPLVALWLVAARRRQGARRLILSLASFALAGAAVIAPLAWHNAKNDERPEGAYADGAPHAPSEVTSNAETLHRLVTGRSSPLGWADGVNLYLGNLPELVDLNRDDNLTHFRRFLEINKAPWRDGARTATEHSRWFRAKTFAYIRSHPGAWLKLLGDKLLEVINGYETPRGTSPYGEREYSRLLSALLWGPPFTFPSCVLLPLGVAGAFAERRRPRAVLVGLVMGMQLLFVVAFFVTSRYRIPALPLCAVLSVGLLARALPRMATRRGWTRGFALGALATVALLTLGTLHLPGQTFGRGALERYNLAAALAEEGKRTDAMFQLRAALGVAPDFGAAHNNLGRLLQDSGGLEEAIGEYELALELESDNARAANNLGTALVARGDDRSAEAVFRAAASMDPNYLRPRVNLGELLLRRGDAAGALLWLREAREKGLSDETVARDIVRAEKLLGEQTGR